MKFKYTPSLLEILDTDSKVTRKVKLDYNTMTNSMFMNKYQCSKLTYVKRVTKYGDPYMNAPLAKIGKILNKLMGTK